MIVLDPAVTIVLPVHNAERNLRSLVVRILDLATAPMRRLTLALVDDGSTDETFEAASEIARDFPQVRVFRQPCHGGLGAALEEIRRRLGVDEVIVHDGVGPMDLDELAAVLAASAPDRTPHPAASMADAASGEGRGSRRFAAVSALNNRMAAAHRAIASFHWMTLVDPARPRRRSAPLSRLISPPLASDFPVPLP
jgi:glycosyltransferase involved in cell wall biosynthesis